MYENCSVLPIFHGPKKPVIFYKSVHLPGISVSGIGYKSEIPVKVSVDFSQIISRVSSGSS